MLRFLKSRNHAHGILDACNARGSWGAGIARDFARQVRPADLIVIRRLLINTHKYPWAYTKYRDYCLKWKGENILHDIPNLHATGDEAKTISVRYPVGTALIIRPEASCFAPGVLPWVICLFTSADYGNRVDSPDMILSNTNAALHDLRQKVDDMEKKRHLGVSAINELYACRFNSGLFGIPWAKTRELVDEVALGLPLTIVYPPEADNESETGRKRVLNS